MFTAFRILERKESKATNLPTEKKTLLSLSDAVHHYNWAKYFSGELAENFSVLVRVLHSGQFKCVSPGDFKRTVGKFKSQFSGYDQQDSQELLAFLMDGLQEDLNKVLLVLWTVVIYCLALILGMVHMYANQLEVSWYVACSSLFLRLIPGCRKLSCPGLGWGNSVTF